MAGSDPGFDPNAFREAIEFAQLMGMPPEAERQATFYFPDTVTWDARTDDSGLPFDPGASQTVVAGDAVRVPCAIEFRSDLGDVEWTELGILQPTRVIVELLDVHHAMVEGCSHVMIDGDRYNYRFTEPPAGLFEVGIFRLHFASESEQ